MFVDVYFSAHIIHREVQFYYYINISAIPDLCIKALCHRSESRRLFCVNLVDTFVRLLGSGHTSLCASRLLVEIVSANLVARKTS